MTEIELLAEINNGIQILVAINLLTFVMSCSRAWRNNTLRMGD